MPKSAEEMLEPAAAAPKWNWREGRHLLPVLAVVILVGFWFVTWGEGDLFERESFCRFYDALGRSMLEGRFDVPSWAIGFESYLFEGKHYGYFGIGPALLRVPLLLLFDDMDGLWSRWMVFCASLLNLVGALGILRHLRGGPAVERHEKVLEILFVLIVGLGSSNLFILSRSFVFHEAIAWGSTAALVAAWLLLRFLQAPRWSVLLWLGAWTFLSFHARASIGAGALLLLCLLALLLGWRWWSARGRESAGPPSAAGPHAAATVLLILGTVGTYFGVNYAKFRTFDGIPMRYYEMYLREPSRMAVTGGRQIQPQNLPTGVASYLFAPGVRFRPEFPWVYAISEPIRLGRPALDVVEPFSTLPVNFPALTWLAGLGIFALFGGRSEALRHARWPSLCLALGGGIMCMTVSITHRYLHDLYPALVICAAAGVAHWGAHSGRRNAPVLALGVLALWSVLATAAFALVFQRTAAWGVPPEKRAEFLHWRQIIDGTPKH